VESNAERQELTHQQRAVAQLLDAQWDPMGVYEDARGPIAGEYEAYAWRVLKQLREGASGTEIAELLAEIRVRDMELLPGPEDARAAQALADWYRRNDA
jgi:hypothetical protein